WNRNDSLADRVSLVERTLPGPDHPSARRWCKTRDAFPRGPAHRLDYPSGRLRCALGYFGGRSQGLRAPGHDTHQRNHAHADPSAIAPLIAMAKSLDIPPAAFRER